MSYSYDKWFAEARKYLRSAHEDDVVEIGVGGWGDVMRCEHGLRGEIAASRSTIFWIFPDEKAEPASIHPCP